jgi:DNA-binding NtrC family response regulator
MPSLYAIAGPTRGVRYTVVGEVTIGRSPSCEIPILDGKVSRRHARVFLIEGKAMVEDLGSRNGTRVNGAKLKQPAPIQAGDKVQVGEATFIFEGALSGAESPGAVAALEARAVADAGRLRGLLEAAGELAAAPSGIAAMRLAVEAACRVLQGERAAVYLGVGGEASFVAGASGMVLSSGALSAALNGQTAMASADALAAPIRSGGEQQGVIACQRKAPFDEEDAHVLAALGGLLGAALRGARAREAAPPRVAGSSDALTKAIENADRQAASGGPVLVLGEPGSGRGTLARFLHARSPRAFGPVVEVPCARVDAAVLLGAASSSAPGAVEQADGGTLVLSDIHLMGEGLQEKVARILADQVVAREGASRTVAVDVRVVATSATDLTDLARHGRFDKELARRLSGARIDLPPLRGRKDDILPLAEHFIERHRVALGRGPLSLNDQARAALTGHGWPGNLRELEAVCARLALHVPDGRPIGVEDLPPEVQVSGSRGGAGVPLADQIARLEKAAVSDALRQARGKKIRAAAILGISRPTLDKKIALYGLVAEGDA